MLSISGQELESLGEGSFKIGGRKHISAIVTKNMPCRILIGIDTLLRPNSVLDLEAKTVKIMGQTYPLEKQSSQASVGCVNVGPKVKDPYLQNLLAEYADTFSNPREKLRASSLPPAEIKTEGPPIRQRPYRLPFQKRQMVEKKCKKC